MTTIFTSDVLSTWQVCDFFCSEFSLGIQTHKLLWYQSLFLVFIFIFGGYYDRSI
jgi:hypothetical protein